MQHNYPHSDRLKELELEIALEQARQKRLDKEVKMLELQKQIKLMQSTPVKSKPETVEGDREHSQQLWDNKFEMEVFHILQNSPKCQTHQWKSLPKLDVSRGLAHSQETDCTIISKKFGAVIEAKSLIGTVKPEGDITNTSWFCYHDGGKKTEIRCSGYRNPYKQVKCYSLSLKNLLESYPTPHLNIWQQLVNSLPPSPKALLKDHAALLSFDVLSARIGVRSPELTTKAQSFNMDIVRAFKALNQGQDVHVKIEPVSFPIPSASIFTYGIIVFPEGTDISQIGFGSERHYRSINEFYRVTTLDYLVDVLETIEIDAIYRSQSSLQLSLEEIENLLCGKFLYP